MLAEGAPPIRGVIFFRMFITLLSSQGRGPPAWSGLLGSPQKTQLRRSFCIGCAIQHSFLGAVRRLWVNRYGTDVYLILTADSYTVLRSGRYKLKVTHVPSSQGQACHSHRQPHTEHTELTGYCTGDTSRALRRPSNDPNHITVSTARYTNTTLRVTKEHAGARGKP